MPSKRRLSRKKCDQIRLDLFVRAGFSHNFTISLENSFISILLVRDTETLLKYCVVEDLLTFCKGRLDNFLLLYLQETDTRDGFMYEVSASRGDRQDGLKELIVQIIDWLEHLLCSSKF